MRTSHKCAFSELTESFKYGSGGLHQGEQAVLAPLRGPVKLPRNQFPEEGTGGAKAKSCAFFYRLGCARNDERFVRMPFSWKILAALIMPKR